MTAVRGSGGWRECHYADYPHTAVCMKLRAICKCIEVHFLVVLGRCVVMHQCALALSIGLFCAFSMCFWIWNLEIYKPLSEACHRNASKRMVLDALPLTSQHIKKKKKTCCISKKDHIYVQKRTAALRLEQTPLLWWNAWHMHFSASEHMHYKLS